jgi:hypothetical protein
MIKIELREVERKIEASRKKAPEVPKLADRLVQLQFELNSELKYQEDLSQQLESLNKDEQATTDDTDDGNEEKPEGGKKRTGRMREIPGEDPDPEALKAKIQVLEERLNSKKEALLEKELILDEVTNISENLRKQSIDGRYNTLEITSKVNDLQARLKKITRQMMATISELSMFQANLIKLDSEKGQVYNQVEEMRARVEKGLPPTDESEIEFLRLLRDKKRHLEMREVSSVVTSRRRCRSRWPETAWLPSLSTRTPNRDPTSTSMKSGSRSRMATLDPSNPASWACISDTTNHRKQEISKSNLPSTLRNCQTHHLPPFASSIPLYSCPLLNSISKEPS